MTDQDKPLFLQAFNCLVVALRDKEPDTVTLRVYFEALKDLEIEFVVAAAERLAKPRSDAWFPKAPEWGAMAQRIEHERLDQQRAILRKLPSPLCRACADTGWASDDQQRVKRCECQTMRRLEVLGRRPMPALPEANVEPVNPEALEQIKAMLRPIVADKSWP